MKTYKIISLMMLLIVTVLQGQNNNADQAYEKAYQHILNQSWDQAITALEDVISQNPGSQWIDDARFWQCYAREKSGMDLKQVAACYEKFLQEYKKSKWQDDAKSNLLRVSLKLSKLGETKYDQKIKEMQKDEDLEIAMAALMALQQMGDEQSVPIVIQLFNKTDNPKLQEQMLFILGNSNNPEAEEKLVSIINSKSADAGLKDKAIFWLGQSATSDKSIALIVNIAKNNPDTRLQERAIFALAQLPDAKGLPYIEDLALTHTNPSIRSKAVFWLGQHLKTEQQIETIMQIVQTDKDQKVREKALMALAQTDHPKALDMLYKIAQDHSEFEMREKAIFWLGQSGSSNKTVELLIHIANHDADIKVRESALFALSQIDEIKASEALVHIAKNSPDLNLRKKAIFWLGQRKDEVSRKALLEIISASSLNSDN